MGRADSMNKNNKETTQIVYEFVKTFIKEHTYPPTLREIARACFLSTSAVTRHLERLQGEGKINREWGVARGITLVDED
jgi:repressor LexA